MAWQDELRQLDEELAAGRISAAEYRSRRDQVVSAAANPGQPTGIPEQPFQSQPFYLPPNQQPQPQQPPQPQGQQQGQGPLPPSAAESTQLIPPITGGMPPQGHNPDATQIVPGTPGGAGNSAEHTQFVPNASPERTQAVNPNWTARPPQQRPSDAERTQVVPSVGFPQGNRPNGPGSPPSGFPQQGRPGPNTGPWGQQQPQPQPSDDDLSPPWAAGGDFPPLVPQPSDAWLKQGPEVFEDGKSHTGRIVAIVLAVVVLAGVAFGAYWLFGRNTSPGPAPAQPSQTQTTTKKPPPPNPLAIAKLPGTSTGKSVQDFDDVIALNYLNPVEQNAYQTAQPTRAAVGVNAIDDPKGQAIVLTVQAGDTDLAKAAVTALVAQQVANHAEQVAGQPTGVTVTAAGATVRGHYYTSKGVIVRVEVTEPDAAAALQEFDTVLAAQLKALPADAE